MEERIHFWILFEEVLTCTYVFYVNSSEVPGMPLKSKKKSFFSVSKIRKFPCWTKKHCERPVQNHWHYNWSSPICDWCLLCMLFLLSFLSLCKTPKRNSSSKRSRTDTTGTAPTTTTTIVPSTTSATTTTTRWEFMPILLKGLMKNDFLWYLLENVSQIYCFSLKLKNL